MRYLAFTTLIFTTRALAYWVTTCSLGCTSSGCQSGGQERLIQVAPALNELISVDQTQCLTWPAGGEPPSWKACNIGEQCSSPRSYGGCFAASDGSGTTVCNVPGTYYLQIYS